MNYKYLMVLVIVLFAFPVFAETVELKNGQTIEGKIVANDGNKVQVDFNGVVLTFWMDEIVSIDKKPVAGLIRDVESGTSASKEETTELSSKVPKSAFFMGEQQTSVINDIVRNGWKKSDVATTLLVQNKGELARTKESLVQDQEGNEIEKIFHKESLLVNELNETILSYHLKLLLVEAEQARDQNNNALFESNLLSALDICLTLAQQKSFFGSSIRIQTMFFDAISLVLERNIRNKEHDKVFLQKCALKLQQLIDRQQFARIFFSGRIQQIKQEIGDAQNRIGRGESLGEIVKSYELNIPVSLFEQVVPDKKFFTTLSQKFEPIMDKWVEEAKEALRRNALVDFDRKTEAELNASKQKISTNSYSSPQDKFIDIIGYEYLIKFLPKTNSWTSQGYCFFLAEVKVAYIGVLEKLFEMENNRPVTSLSELVPQYADTLPKDNFSDTGNDLKFSNTSDGMRVCSIGLDRYDDQGKKLLTLENMQVNKTAGDICFTF